MNYEFFQPASYRVSSSNIKAQMPNKIQMIKYQKVLGFGF